MKILALLTASLILLPPCAPTKATRPIAVDPDRLTLTCAQILQQSSSDWILYFIDKTGQKSADHHAPTLRALASYGKCYDERTSRLAAALGKSGKGPQMGANGNFRDFQKALDDFTTKALAATQKGPETQAAAYAALYEKQFRYQFYLSYTQKDLLTRALTPQESDDYAKAKNHFGEVLGLLPDETLHPVHAAFRQIFDTGSVSDVTKLELYRFAIFLLAPAKDKPFSPQPF